jgi:hypothetical protein
VCKWCCFRRSSGAVFDDQTLAGEAKLVLFSTIKWCCFRLTKTGKPTEYRRRRGAGAEFALPGYRRVSDVVTVV